MEKQELTTLVNRAKGGDDSAFEEIVREKTDTIKYMSLALLGNLHDAEDISQEIILTIYKKLDTLEDPEAFTTWMYRIINNLCTNKLIKDKKKKQEGDIDKYANIAEEKRAEFSPHEVAENEAVNQIVSEAIEELPKRRRESIIAYYYEEKSYEDIAKEMNISINTVSTNIKRARDALEKIIKGKLYGQDP